MENFLNLSSILFLDIETIPRYPTFDECPEEEQALWLRKAQNLKRGDDESPESIYNRAGIYAEFGKIICISTGFVFMKDGTPNLRVTSFYGEDEHALLESFANLLNKSFTGPEYKLCAHNGKEFDFPYIARRMIINRLTLPFILDTAGKKPWEVNHLDTMELWKFGDFKSYTPLNLLAHVLGVPNPKDDIDGSQVWSVYWQDHDMKRIVTYCEKDVMALVNVFLRMTGREMVEIENIEIV